MTEFMEKDKKYVRVVEITSGGFVSFNFYLGDPDLIVELLLPENAFSEFCEANSVVLLNRNDEFDEEGLSSDSETDARTWSLRDANQRGIN